jgi:indole-3-glycerol phosphate synthase
MTILDKILIDKRAEVAARKELICIQDLKSSPFFNRKGLSLRSALLHPTLFPSASPSSGTPSSGLPSLGTPSSGTPSSGIPSSELPSSGTPSSGIPSSELPSSGSLSLGTTSSPSYISTFRSLGVGIIAEFKRKSPSKGWIHEDADVVEVASGYCDAGAAGISILTDTPWFGGVVQDVLAARPHVSCPVLRKDFIIDEYQLFEAKSMGADVILLIAAALTVDECEKLAFKAKALDLEVLLEVHNKEELGHCNDAVDMVGVNNRNLKTFEVSTAVSFELAPLIPDKFVKVSESGLSDTATLRELMAVGYQGFLMGETFMKHSDPAFELKKLISALVF